MAGKYQSYSECKNSGVEWLGDIPAHWELVPLKVIAKVDNSGCYGAEPEESKHVYPVATTAQIDANGVFRVEAMPKRSFSSTEVSRYLCRDGDILVVKSSGSATNIISGKAGLVNSSTPKFIFSNFLLRISPEQSSACPSFIYGFLTSHLTRERIKQMVSTTTYPNLQVGEYCSAKLPLPPLQEQRTIAAFLDHETARIDRLIEKQQRLIELLKEKRQAVISHAVTKGLDPNVPMKDSGVEWLGQVPEHWGVCQFRYVTTLMQTGPFGSQLHAEDYIEGGIPLINPAHMKDGRLVPEAKASVDTTTQERLARHKLLKNDIILARRGELGRCAVVTGDNEGWLCGTGSLRVTLSGHMVSEYCYQLISSDGIRAELALESKGSTMDNLNTELLGNVRIPLPTVTEQQQILSHIRCLEEKFEALFSRAILQIRLLQERRTALISAAVTGKIDVRNWQPSTSFQTTEPDLPIAAEQSAEYRV